MTAQNNQGDEEKNEPSGDSGFSVLRDTDASCGCLACARYSPFSCLAGTSDFCFARLVVGFTLYRVDVRGDSCSNSRSFR